MTESLQNQAHPVKKPIYKRVWFWLLAVFIGFPIFVVFLAALLPKSEKPAVSAPAEVTPEAHKQDISADRAEELQPQKPEPVEKQNEHPAMGTLGISRRAATKNFRSFPEREGVQINGQDNYIYASGNVMVQVIGDEDDISSASITVTSDGSKKTGDVAGAAIVLFINSLFPERSGEISQAVSKKIGLGGGKLYESGKIIEVSVVKEIGMVNVSVKP